jgi:toxin-antitoxin system PIN domain toxin
MTSSVFLDVNVWLALTSPDHQHSPSAWHWYQSLPESTILVFCRFTQLGLLRLLTTQSIMGQGTLTQSHAWKAYDRWIKDADAEFFEEPAGIEFAFRALSGAHQASSKDWADSYLAAFSAVSAIPLATFDRALAGKARGAILLS